MGRRFFARGRPRSLRPIPVALVAALAAGCAGSMRSAAPVQTRGAVDGDGSAETAQTFFARYVGLIAQPELAFVDLYSDYARVHTLRHLADGTVARLEMTGLQWKRNLTQMYRQVKVKGDPQAAQAFSQVSFSDGVDGLRISARRYVRGSCAVDREFHLVVAPGADGVLRIVEEGSETWVQSQCGIGEGKTLDQRMDELVAQVEPALPLMVAADTRLVRVERAGKQLHHSYVLVAPSATQVSQSELEATKFDVLCQLACASANLRAVLEAGGELGYTYVDREGHRLAYIHFGYEVCKVEPKVVTPAEGGRVG